MATLVLTAVGSAVGGPVGGAIGSILGQYVDRTVLFAPKPRQGPRLGDLAVQTSSYGSDIPKIFGTMRVAGTVIWATDLAEHRSTSGASKGQPQTINYSYSASFAVALSGRPVHAVRRIWAEGKLLRGMAGDFKSGLGAFRLHPGDEDQPIDPLIASAEGASAAAFRGTAYAVFEDLQLADFGNRIPSLTFEVEADEGEIGIGAIGAALSGGIITSGETPGVLGYAASGDSVRSALAALVDAASLSLAEDGGTLRLTTPVGPALNLGAGEEVGRREIVRRGAGSVSCEVSLAYYEPARDYQAGLQRATTGSQGPSDRLALPAALAADAAKALAEHRLAAASAGRLTARLGLSWRAAAVRPGTQVALAGDAATWTVKRATLGPLRVDLDLIRSAAPVSLVSDANPGRQVAAVDQLHGSTLLHFLDLPLGEPTGGKPLLLAAAAGASPGWRRATLTASFDGGASWRAAGPTAAPAVTGTTLDALGEAGSALFDLWGEVSVELASEAMWLESRTDDALVAGANLALVGDELIQFGLADALGGRRFRLSRLLRGRRGTEWAAGTHLAGERFVLIETDALAAIEAPAGGIGGSARLLAAGIGDPPEGAAAELAIEGASLQPPAPVHLRASETPGGDLMIRWIRRSRRGWAWASGSDMSLGEEIERYRVELVGTGFARTAFVDGPEYLYLAADRAADGGGSVSIAIVEIGTYAASRAARTTFG
jgi:hypothetical protein